MKSNGNSQPWLTKDNGALYRKPPEPNELVLPYYLSWNIYFVCMPVWCWLWMSQAHLEKQVKFWIGLPCINMLLKKPLAMGKSYIQLIYIKYIWKGILSNLYIIDIYEYICKGILSNLVYGGNSRVMICNN